MTSVQSHSACIGVFDSGVGGLSVLRALRGRLPGVPLRYLADSAHAPYGGREAAHIIGRSLALTQRLLEDGATLIVVACNTATVQAIAALRERWPALPFIGVEPGIKPAAAQTRTGRIAVMATAATVASARVQRLVEQHAGDAEVLLQGCSGVVDVIERADGDSAALLEVLRPYCERVRAFGERASKEKSPERSIVRRVRSVLVSKTSSRLVGASPPPSSGWASTSVRPSLERPPTVFVPNVTRGSP